MGLLDTAIGAPLRKWTLLLLLCSVPTPACAQAANETAHGHAGATAAPSSTTTTTTTTTPHPHPSTSTIRTFIATTCPFRTINYITHTLPQQCAKTAWSATPSPLGEPPQGTETADSAGETAGTGTASEETESELETESPLDNANFLSFEEWKKRNLAQVGQSPEHVQGRAAPSNQAARRRPVNVNALDSLGDEAEIELDFSGFGPPLASGEVANQKQAAWQDADGAKAAEAEKKVAPSSWALSKDAGKTCKERFNYASFDCAATVLKTNKQAKSATSVLVENKDSYMLNECSANNKFLIVELCDDILVDTVVLGNYEFFSSMFRHFRVSVSDRYPVKMERWKDLATFEARNSRDLQPFLITEPQIWARYLRIEFLTHYGNEFYCPISLLRVHGTTMMEQFRREEEEARGVDDDVDLEAEQDVIKPALDSGPIPADQVPVLPIKDSEAIAKQSVVDPTPAAASNKHSTTMESSDQQAGGIRRADNVSSTTAVDPSASAKSSQNAGTSGHDSTSASGGDDGGSHVPSSIVDSLVASRGDASSHASSVSASGTPSPHTPNSSSTNDTANVSSSTDARNMSQISQAVNHTVPTPSTAAAASKIASNNTVSSSTSQSSHNRVSSTQPNPATPSTQESFFKSIHKRLLNLEANSTLSLQYIEEQSRILRDAFVKVEKRQLIKTERFLDHLNSTVMQELKSFRTMYDQLWQSTVIELESMKERQNNEINEIGTRLTLMADELVWQKRMAVVQSTLLLLCLGLVLFVRSGTLGSAADVPIVQQLGSKYNSFFESSPPRSPPESGIARRRRTLKNMWRSDTSAGLSDHQSDGMNALSDVETDGARSPTEMEHCPPTPTTPAALAAYDVRNGTDVDLDDHTMDVDDQAKRLEVLETQSGPATPNGTRDSRPSWEEVDRAVDQLKAEEVGHSLPRSSKKRRDKKSKKRSPLRREHSSFDGTADFEANMDTADEACVS
ncbi:hypothetical protein ACEQ8H_000325 [Pleosporales sp. CAS-2024a]